MRRWLTGRRWWSTFPDQAAFSAGLSAGAGWVLEGLVAGLVALAPWAYGAREAWALHAVAVGVAAIALCLTAVLFLRPGAAGARGGLASLALAGLVGLALFQLAPWPEAVLRKLDPALGTLRAAVLPAVPERLTGTEPVRLPRPTLTEDPEATLRTAVDLGALWVLFQAATVLAARPGALRRFCQLLAAAACLVSLESLIQLLSWDGRIYGVRHSPWASAGPFYNHNHLAAYLNLGLAATLGLLGSCASAPARRGRGPAVLYSYAAGMIVVGVIASLSRMGFVAMSAVLLAAAWVVRARGKPVWWGLIAAASLSAVVLLVMGPSLGYAERLATVADGSAFGSRMPIWRDAVRGVLSRPLWGTGFGTFGGSLGRFQTTDQPFGFLHAENEYLEWLFEGGVVALALWGVFGFGLSSRSWAAVRSAPRGSRRGPVLAGAVVGLISLAVHSWSDFALHTAAVALPAVVLAAFVNASGGPPAVDLGRRRWPSWVGPAALSLTACGVGSAAVLLYARAAACEALLERAALTLHDRYDRVLSRQPAFPEATGPQRDRVARALRLRPDWAEGHLTLARIDCELYERAVTAAIREFEPDLEDGPSYATTLWAHRQAHAGGPSERAEARRLAREGEAGRHLDNALRSFLEARRCNLALALPQAEAGVLSFLMERGDRSEEYLRRAALLAGSKASLLERVALAAAQAGRADLAADCWRKALTAGDGSWESIADAAAVWLPPEMILERVAPDGRHAVWFAAHLFPGPDGQEFRDSFVTEALRRFEAEEERGPRSAELLGWKAKAYLELGNVETACDLLRESLALQPYDLDRRCELVEQLILLGRYEEAHGQAVRACTLFPDRPAARKALIGAAEALAKGTEGVPPDSLASAPR